MQTPTALSLISGFLALAAFAQQPAPEIQLTSPTTWEADWTGSPNRTYFMQWSADLTKWEYLSEMKFGEGSHHMGANASEPHGFFRLSYWDDPSISDLEAAKDADFDDDYISNWDEIRNSATNPLNSDSDHDGLSDSEELFGYYYETDPNNWDSDDDGIGDGDEVFDYYSDPTRTDSDGDGLDDGAEVTIYGTDPARADSDFDGLDDGDEINTHDTNPNLADSDDDGLSDGDEFLIHRTNPLDPDSDNDEMPDGWEIDHDFDPNSQADAVGDPDNDNLSNLEEFKNGSNPALEDTVGDGLIDGDEVKIYNTNPTLADSDADGLDDDEEINTLGTNPLSRDTDGDGISDFTDTAPNENFQYFADADGDGISDSMDSNPNTPRGAAPVISAPSSGADQMVNVIAGEELNFHLHVSNPGGEPATDSQIKFFADGTETAATVTDLGGGNFVIKWRSQLHHSYPDKIVQLATAKFTDSEGAVAWKNFASIDVAEWEGLIGGVPYEDSIPGQFAGSAIILKHLSGKSEEVYLAGTKASRSTFYRGPLSVRAWDDGDPNKNQISGFEIPPDMRFPMFYLKTRVSPMAVAGVIETGDYAQFPDDSALFLNNLSSQVNFEWGAGAASVSPNSTLIYLLRSPQERYQTIDATYGASLKLINKSWRVFGPYKGTRITRHFVNIYESGGRAPHIAGLWMRSYLPISITPHREGSEQHPGLPSSPKHLDMNNGERRPPHLVATDTYYHMTFKIDPGIEHIAQGVKIALHRPNSEDFTSPLPPQSGMSLYENVELAPMALDPSGAITLTPSQNPALFQKLISPDGLTLLLKRDSAANQLHHLKIITLVNDSEIPEVEARRLKILPVDIAVDANRDGEITFDGQDKTTVEKPYRFWVNDDQDIGNDDEADDIDSDSDQSTTADSSDSFINSWRDLEDFARIQIKISGFLEQLKNGEITATLKFKDGTVQGNPALNLWLHLDPDGGRDYIENESSAQLHVGSHNRPRGMEAESPARITNVGGPGHVYEGHGYTFTKDFWDGSVSSQYPEIMTINPVRYLLFEGRGEGKGELVLEFREGEAILGEVASCWLELKDIKKMYEEYTMAGIYGKSWQEINQIAPTADTDDLSASEKAVYTTFKLPEVFEYPIPDEDAADYEKDYILFVHGWRMKPSEKYAFAETAYKRLWHRGYRGRFGTFSWPTEWTNRHSPLAISDGILWDPRNYDRSDRKAYLSGTALNSLLHRLNGIYPGRVRMFAHSMGNVVASQALRNEAKKSDAQVIVHTYAACQAASVAFAYDADNPRTMTHGYISTHPQVTGAVQAGATLTAPESTRIPEVYGHFPFAFPETQEYFTGIDGVVSGNIGNVHNWTDSALAAWMVGQWQKPDTGWGYSALMGDGIEGPVWWRQDGFGRRVLSLYSEAPEVLAHVAEAKSPALGASVEGGNSTQKAITQNLDTMAAFSQEQKFEGDDEDHSAQFRSINMRRWEFWDKLLRDRNFFHIQTIYPLTQ